MFFFDFLVVARDKDFFLTAGGVVAVIVVRLAPELNGWILGYELDAL